MLKMRLLKETKDLSVLSWKFTAPALAILNLIDTFLSYYFFQAFGVDVEANPLVRLLITIDTSKVSYLVAKVGFSVILLVYWKKAKQIPVLLSGLCVLGVLLYLGMFIHGAIVIFLV